MNHNRQKLKSGVNGFIAICLFMLVWVPPMKFKTEMRKGDPIKVTVPNKDNDFFYVDLKDSLEVEQSTYDSPSKILAISDIEGNFDGLYSFLISNKVIDKDYNWTFGDGHVVFLGDFVDRGNESIEVLWLIYKLEQEAMKYNGKVHYILGNHEVLNVQGVGYTENKYTKGGEYVSEFIPFDKSHKVLFSPKSELGRWLRTKNAMEKIGDYTFVHGGISPKLLLFKPDYDQINNTIRKYIEDDLYNFHRKTKFANFVHGREGPLWFRGLARDYKYYNKVSQSEYKQIQTFFNSPKIVIGHTIGDDIKTDFDGSLIKLDIVHGHEKFSGKTKGLLVEDGSEFKVDDQGNKSKL